MAITLRKALNIGGLQKCEVVAGQQGLDKLINYVTIMEVPDIVRWLKGKELLLTSLYPIKDDEHAMNNLVRDLNDKGTTALAIKAHRFIEQIPDVILKEAEKYQFPIIEIPEEISYLDILSPVTNVIFDDKVVLQEDLEQAYQLLDEIKLNKWNVTQFTDTLSHLLKNDILIESLVSYLETPASENSLEPLTHAQKGELEMIQRPVRITRCKSSDSRSLDCIIAPIIMEGQLYGTITSIGVKKEYIEMDLAVLERASTILSLEFMRKKAAYELEQQYKSDFFRDLLFSQIQSQESMVEKGKLYGFDQEQSYVFVSIQFSFGEKGITLIANHVNQLEVICSQLDSKSIIGAVQNGLYLLYPSRDKGKQRIERDIQTIYNELKKSIPSALYIGVRRPAKDISEIRDGFEQAKQAVILGRSLFNEKYVIYYEDLGFYRLLAEINNTVEIKKFHEESVGELIKYDKDHELELIHTLTTYFANNESLSQSAKTLFIHVNTLKYRLQRIKLLSGLDLHNSEDKLILQIGLKILKFTENDYRFR